ncbi:MAG: DNA-binding MarR family transcriptional regulator [Flavobacteriales bacterium]|jgi:DNA-binding MarR family transcriptional regulator
MFYMDIIELQNIIERVAGLLRSETRSALVEHGLQPVQFEVLHYLSECNRYSDTPMAVTEYLGQTKGTVSQTLKVLEKNVLLEKVADASDKRVTHLQLTVKALNLLSLIRPSRLLSEALSESPDADKIFDSHKRVLGLIQAKNKFQAFGQCQNCVHNRPQNGQFLCGLTEEALSAQDVLKICREYE